MDADNNKFVCLTTLISSLLKESEPPLLRSLSSHNNFASKVKDQRGNLLELICLLRQFCAMKCQSKFLENRFSDIRTPEKLEAKHFLEFAVHIRREQQETVPSQTRSQQHHFWVLT